MHLCSDLKPAAFRGNFSIYKYFIHLVGFPGLHTGQSQGLYIYRKSVYIHSLSRIWTHESRIQIATRHTRYKRLQNKTWGTHTVKFVLCCRWEGQSTGLDLGISDNYRAVHWTPMRAHILQELYHETPLSMQCNQSTGERFPGYWENMPITPVLFPLPPPPRDCATRP
jgi:hypothetical protein